MSSSKQKVQVLGIRLLVTLALFLSSTVIAAPASFYREFGDATRSIGDDVVQLADGSYVVVGSTRSFAVDNFDVWATRLDENGTPLWRRTFGGTDNEFALSVIASGDGGVVFTAFIGAGSFGGSAQDAWVVRLDAAGDIVWQKVFTGPGFDQIRAVKLLPDGGFALAGFTSPGFSPFHVWVKRVDSTGNTLWGKFYPAAAFGMGLAVSADGNLLVTGLTDDLPADLLLTKIDASDGTVIWANQYGGTEHDGGNDLVVLPGGSIVVSGRSASFGTANRDSWIIRTDSSGALEWQIAFGGPGTDGSSGIGYVDGDIVIAGSDDFNSPGGSNFGWIARLDAETGDLLWRRSVVATGVFNTGLGVDITLDGGAVAVGTRNTSTSTPQNLGDIFVTKINAVGTVLSCPVLEDAPVVSYATSATVTPLALVALDFFAGAITSIALPNNAPISTTLVCLANPIEFLADLSDLVTSLDIPNGLAASLTAKLANADNVLADSNPNNDQAAINILEAFIDQINALRGKKITDDNADALIAVAQQIIDFLQNNSA